MKFIGKATVLAGAAACAIAAVSAPDAMAGGSYVWNNWLTLHGSYTHIFIKDGDINLPEAAPLPSLTATFEQSVDIVSVGASVHW